jgi:DNA-binding CsgD family transcriptional regulator
VWGDVIGTEGSSGPNPGAGPARTDEILGRTTERSVLADLLAGAGAGRGCAFVLRGDAGVGKTALLDDMVRSADGFEVMRIAGIESEMHLSFAGLHALLLPYLAHRSDLPAPQRNALESAFGLSPGDPADRFLVALSILTMLDKVAETRPVCCVVEDAQWLDSESLTALAFVGRRLRADRIGLFFSTRAGYRVLDGLPEMQLDGLGDEFARRLLESTVTGRLDPRVAAVLVAEARGNPLALVEFARALTAEQLAGVARVPDQLPLGERLEHHFQGQIKELPEATQLLLLVIAAEPSGDAALIWRAARTLGVAEDALDIAVARGVIAPDSPMRFRHPLIRSAAYSGATRAELRLVHQALASVADEAESSDRRAWHLAVATVGPSEEVAEQLERSAVGARSRGGYASESAFMERAAELSVDSSSRSRRLIAAAQAKLISGAPGAARRLLDRIKLDEHDTVGHIQTIRLRAAIAVPLGNYHDAGSLLLGTALELEPLDPDLARATMLEALEVVVVTRHRTVGTSPADIGREAAQLSGGSTDRPLDAQLVRGFATLLAGGHVAAVPLLRELMGSLGCDATSSDDVLRWNLLGLVATQELWDRDLLESWTGRVVEVSRGRGALEVLRSSLCAHATSKLFAGEFAEAAALHDEARSIGTAIRGPAEQWAAMQADLLAWEGREAEAREAARVLERGALTIGAGSSEHFALLALVVLELGLSHFREAFELAGRVCREATMGAANQALVELVEAAVRCNELDAADRALARLEPHLTAAATDWSAGLLARSRALRAGADEADALYAEAITRLTRSRVAIDLARAHLLYGEWLRRAGRRSDARAQLRVAVEMLTTIGAMAFAERARTELLATGERPQHSKRDALTDLTPQEERIARLAAGGAMNVEIAAQLFISPHTVDYHLRHVFRKLEITSRRQLAAALPPRS